MQVSKILIFSKTGLQILDFFYRPDVAPSTSEKNDIPPDVLNKKNNATLTKKISLRPSTLLLCKKSFVSQKTQKSELCQFS